MPKSESKVKQSLQNLYQCRTEQHVDAGGRDLATSRHVVKKADELLLLSTNSKNDPTASVRPLIQPDIIPNL